VQVAELAPAEPELDAAEAVRVLGHALPREHLGHDARCVHDRSVRRETGPLVRLPR
jgi:hypothetical protein